MKTICSINGTIQPVTKATISITSVEAEYGFGVYETIKVRNGIIYFVSNHIERLFHSAKCIELEHTLTKPIVERYVREFVQELEEDSSNLKLLLYGGNTPKDSTLFILSLAPYYPNRKWYKEGVSLVSYEYERWMPQAKTLNMLASYYFYKKAKAQGCYDALLLDHNKQIVEGTRTNVFLVKGNTIYCPPENNILAGVTMLSLKKVIKKHPKYQFLHKEIPFSSISEYDGMFVTSTSTKILPVKKVDSFEFPLISEPIMDLIKIYDEALEKSKGEFSLL